MTCQHMKFSVTFYREVAFKFSFCAMQVRYVKGMSTRGSVLAGLLRVRLLTRQNEGICIESCYSNDDPRNCTYTSVYKEK